MAPLASISWQRCELTSYSEQPDIFIDYNDWKREIKIGAAMDLAAEDPERTENLVKNAGAGRLRLDGKREFLCDPCFLCSKNVDLDR